LPLTLKSFTTPIFPAAKAIVAARFDVLVRQKIGQYEMLIVLDCKDYAKPVDVKGV